MKKGAVGVPGMPIIGPGILVKLLLRVYGRACPARAPERKGWGAHCPSPSP